MRLLKALGAGAVVGSVLSGEGAEFERVVLYGVVEFPGREYRRQGIAARARETAGWQRGSLNVLTELPRRVAWARKMRADPSGGRLSRAAPTSPVIRNARFYL
ncbi:hypothetical protein ACFXPI_03450 [Streptomyces sp. NPDC059104]|uniref:hypothetical protein n=1 Tax=Streptomyces sp. NPDC059104 TaxID=3346729 RepID=UPI003685C303